MPHTHSCVTFLLVRSCLMISFFQPLLSFTIFLCSSESLINCMQLGIIVRIFLIQYDNLCLLTWPFNLYYSDYWLIWTYFCHLIWWFYFLPPFLLLLFYFLASFEFYFYLFSPFLLWKLHTIPFLLGINWPINSTSQVKVISLKLISILILLQKF